MKRSTIGVAVVLGLVGLVAASRAQASVSQDPAGAGAASSIGFSVSVPAEYSQVVLDAAAASSVPADTLARLIYTESRFRPNAYNASSGATGIAQFLPATAAAQGFDPTDPVASIWGAAAYLDYLYQKFNTWYYAVAAYNWGEGNVAKLLSQGYVTTRSGATLTTLPAETLAYVTGIVGQAGA